MNMIISEPLELQDNPQIFTVSQIAFVLDQTIKSTLGQVSIRGEISNLKISSAGHIYFSLKDNKAMINAICWRRAETPSIKIADGLEVICTGNISIYPERSNYQIIVQKLEIYGEGALLALLEKRKKQLADEGLFLSQHKKGLPLVPTTLAVITSLEGAVIRDIMHRIRARFPLHVLLWGVPVQGQNAAEKIALAIKGLNQLECNQKPDLIIIARGGGSIEDLWPFNEEIVARAAFASIIPIISAIGHETDYTILDMVADIRAPTPTAAAELALPKREDLALRIQKDWQRIDNLLLMKMQKAANILALLETKLDKRQQFYNAMLQYIDTIPNLLQKCLTNMVHNRAFLLSREKLKPIHLHNSLKQKQLVLRDLVQDLNKNISRILHHKLEKLNNSFNLLTSYNYKNVLKRGFVLIRQNDTVLKSTKNILTKTQLDIEFYDGIIKALVLDTDNFIRKNNPEFQTKTSRNKNKSQLQLFNQKN